jgi:hypothetical protein
MASSSAQVRHAILSFGPGLELEADGLPVRELRRRLDELLVERAGGPAPLEGDLRLHGLLVGERGDLQHLGSPPAGVVGPTLLAAG